MKAYFLQRVMAFLIDIFLIAFIILAIRNVFPVTDKYLELEKEYTKLQEESVAEDIIDLGYFTGELGHLSYEMEKENFAFTIVELSINILYFVWFQVVANGQTIGKKLMRITIKKENDEAIGFGDSMKRGMILHGFFASILLAVCFPILMEDSYIAFSLVLQFMVGVLFLISILMAAIRQDGKSLHDLLSKTKVVLVDERLVEPVVIKEVVTTTGEIEKAIVVDEEAVEEQKEKAVKKKKTTKPRAKTIKKEVE